VTRQIREFTVSGRDQLDAVLRTLKTDRCGNSRPWLSAASVRARFVGSDRGRGAQRLPGSFLTGRVSIGSGLHRQWLLDRAPVPSQRDIF